ncbi:transcriptional regulator family: Fungal Specific TF [Paecilomyces variotii]|nr:transcriptional regulator family: Fungal Specific TF [Paecilomyces variotii]
MDKTRFIQYVPGSSRAPRPKAPRLHHKKSKAGCQQCRARRVKCDEIHPVCGSCDRHNVACVYEDVFKLITIPPPSHAGHNGNDSSKAGKTKNHDRGGSNSGSNTPDPDPGGKHLLELRLLHHYSIVTSQTLPTSPEPKLADIWKTYVPRLAFQHRALLDSIYSIAALQLSLTQPGNRELMAAHGQYMDQAIQKHREDIAQINNQMADAVWFTSSLLRVAAFASLQERPIEPYTPPMQWFRIAVRATHIFEVVYELVRHDPSSEALKVMKEGYFTLNQHLMFRDESKNEYSHLLDRSDNARYRDEPWDEDIQRTYESVVKYLGGLSSAIKSKRPAAEIGLQCIAFGSRIPERFIELVEDRQPRALVILAHLFSSMTGFEHIWYIGKLGQRELRGLRTVIPDDWNDML